MLSRFEPVLYIRRPGFDFRQVLGIFFFAIASSPALGPTQLPIQWVPNALPPGLEANHLSPSSIKVKNAWWYTSTPPFVFMA